MILSSILGFLKLLYEHKEKVILGALFVAFIVFGVAQWREKSQDDLDDGGKKKPGKKVTRKTGNEGVRDPKTYKTPNLGNPQTLERYFELVNGRIFVQRKKEAGSGEDIEAQWAEIGVKSIFDATRSGNFIAIIEVDKRRMFVKEGEQFREYTIKRIDGVRNCLTVIRRGSKTGDEEREFCKEE